MGVFRRIIDFFNHWYYQYIIHTAVLMLEPKEIKIFNTILIAFIAMASYTAYLYLPGHLLMLTRFIEHLVTSHYNPFSVEEDSGAKT